ncbi:hypothetical protein EPUS_06829 [Endocarpon pusillum Z07020]|uniref:Uncharacterized protein n=1 Tax=Endocarpon pusillum (strain Z07020 / HMAS-L-300199) TaxID=1263415 RepID=U1G2E1_ENDPU|nr:uncharacterized protein EPUS_06829 [Endocarpon pusillum Z07020]ERF71447.1 hypothetical protein EPUS_06829 [Endocarpon pusillum Z07020]
MPIAYHDSSSDSDYGGAGRVRKQGDPKRFVQHTKNRTRVTIQSARVEHHARDPVISHTRRSQYSRQFDQHSGIPDSGTHRPAFIPVFPREQLEERRKIPPAQPMASGVQPMAPPVHNMPPPVQHMPLPVIHSAPAQRIGRHHSLGPLKPARDYEDLDYGESVMRRGVVAPIQILDDFEGPKRYGESDSEPGSEYSLPVRLHFGHNDIPSPPTSVPAPQLGFSGQASLGKSSYYQTVISQVLHSRYAENGIEEESWGELTIQPIDHRYPANSSVDLFRWVHLHNEVMHFGSFLDTVSAYLEDAGKDKNDTKMMLERVRRQAEKPLSHLSGKYLDPVLIQDTFFPKNGPSGKSSHNILFLCLPFFSLEVYSPSVLPEKSFAHPLRSLLQSPYSSIAKGRDLKQAVYLIFTCARHPTSVLLGNRLKMTKLPLASPNHQNVIQVSDDAGTVWLLDPSECKMWFAFTSAFEELSSEFETEYDILLHGTRIESRDWPRVLREAEGGIVRLVIRQKRRSYRNDTLTSTSSKDGVLNDSSDKNAGGNNEDANVLMTSGSDSGSRCKPPVGSHSSGSDLRSPVTQHLRCIVLDKEIFTNSRGLYLDRPDGWFFEFDYTDGQLVDAVESIWELTEPPLWQRIIDTPHFVRDFEIVDQEGHRGVMFQLDSKADADQEIVLTGAQVTETLRIGRRCWCDSFIRPTTSVIYFRRNTPAGPLYEQEFDFRDTGLDKQPLNMVYYPVYLSGATTCELKKEAAVWVDPATRKVTAHMENHRKSAKLKASRKRNCHVDHNVKDSSIDITTGRAFGEAVRSVLAGKKIGKKARRGTFRQIDPTKTGVQETGVAKAANYHASRVHGDQASDELCSPRTPESKPCPLLSEGRRAKTIRTQSQSFILLPWLAGVTNHQDIRAGSADKGGQTAVETIDAGKAYSDSDHLVNVNRLDEILADTDEFLMKKAKNDERKLYGRCPTADLKSLDDSIWEARIKSRNQSLDGLRDCIKFVQKTKKLLRFFVDIDCGACSVQKCLGGLQLIVEVCGPNHLFSSQLLSSFLGLEKTVKKLRDRLTGENGPLDLPANIRQVSAQDFLRAWVNFIMAVVHIADIANCHRSDGRGIIVADSGVQILRSRSLLEAGLLSMRQSMHSSVLAEKVAVMPLGMISLIVARVLTDLTDDRPDILSTYSTYLERLELDIHSDPLNRAHQEKISHLTQEIRAIIAVLNDQLNVLNGIDCSMQQDLNPNAESVTRRKRSQQAPQSANIRMIESNKDRQESAILAFTIVTIIFLPLSFVASFFGMNTADVRDMTQSQWVYWAAAVPVTALVIGLTLLWAGEVNLARSAFRRLLEKVKSFFGGRASFA